MKNWGITARINVLASLFDGIYLKVFKNMKESFFA